MNHEITAVELRVRYAETDQMGVAHHSHYLVWCEVARTDHMRRRGVTYREIEARGLRLAVVSASVRFRQSARYDDLLSVRCWVRELASRRVVFGYAIDRPDDGTLVATAETALIALDAGLRLTSIPDLVRSRLGVVPDPVRL
ncbi:MAG TPA: thioesterase family protein [Gemmatimonadales bacterium]|nr:thioesterase family protein [Gemmatimonadales bacterium]